jgi:hypothetical protein
LYVLGLELGQESSAYTSKVVENVVRWPT